MLRRGGDVTAEEGPAPTEFLENMTLDLATSGNKEVQQMGDVTLTALREIKAKEDKISSLRSRLQDLEDIREKLEERRDSFSDMGEIIEDRLPGILEESEAEIASLDKKRAMIDFLAGEDEGEEEDRPIVIENQASLVEITSPSLLTAMNRFPNESFTEIVQDEEEVIVEDYEERFVNSTTSDLQEMLDRLKEASISGELEKMTDMMQGHETAFDDVEKNSESLLGLARDIATLKAAHAMAEEVVEDLPVLVSEDMSTPETMVEEELNLGNFEEQKVSMNETLSRVQESITV